MSIQPRMAVLLRETITRNSVSLTPETTMTHPAPQLTATETAAIDAARATLSLAVALLPKESPLRRAYHSALCESERALERVVSVPTRDERRKGEG